MNRQRRAQVRQIVRDIEALPGRIASLAAEEQDAVDNMPESLIDTDRYLEGQEYADFLQEAADTMDDLLSDDPGDATLWLVLENLRGTL